MLPVVHQPIADVPSGLRERKKHEVRERIVDAALDLFATAGFEDTTVAEIAARADVSPATVARYFPAKESLLFSERDVRIAALQAAIAARPAGEAPFAAVAGALREQGIDDEASRRRLLRSRQAIARSTVLRGRATGLLDAWRDGIAAAALERGASPPVARALAVAVVAVLDDAAARWAAADGRTDLDTETDEALRALDGALSTHDPR